MDQQLIFILGGARSGKSAYAEAWARDQAERVLFVATAQALDEEMAARIAHHRARRPPHWRTLEASQAVGSAILSALDDAQVVIVDCLTLLATNVLMSLPDDPNPEQYEAALEREIDLLLEAYRSSKATWLVISNEVGLGIVPAYRSGRLFRDGLGRVNQRVARASSTVIFMLAGLPWILRPATSSTSPSE